MRSNDIDKVCYCSNMSIGPTIDNIEDILVENIGMSNGNVLAKFCFSEIKTNGRSAVVVVNGPQPNPPALRNQKWSGIHEMGTGTAIAGKEDNAIWRFWVHGWFDNPKPECLFVV
jgi:hypothetical protein